MSQPKTSQQSSWFTEVLSLLESSQAFVLATVVGPADHPLIGRHVITESTAASKPTSLGVDEAAWTEAVRAVFAHRAGRVETFACGSSEIQVFMTYCGPPSEAWIFGAGHIACALAPLLDNLGWRVVVCDDRAEFVTSERFPDAPERHAGSFVESARVCAQRSDPWIVLVTRGHQHDQSILQEFVQHRDPGELRPRYIGMIGSKRRVGTVRRQLTDQGFPLSVLDALHAPIGLPIGADTPGEIALAIAAEMVAVRRGFNWDHVSASFRREQNKSGDSADTAGRLDLWRHMGRTIDSGHPCVLATIIDRRGSTPRGLGAQMAVFGNGTAMGTIGGGCGEGVVLRAAREMILGDDAPRLLSVDLTGDQSSEATDVCGGRYSVFCELLKQQ